jgi:hypothetical protein
MRTLETEPGSGRVGHAKAYSNLLDVQQDNQCGQRATTTKRKRKTRKTQTPKNPALQISSVQTYYRVASVKDVLCAPRSLRRYLEPAFDNLTEQRVLQTTCRKRV